MIGTPKGNKDIVKKRLKNHYKKQKLELSTQGKGNKFRYLAVLDFEATCENAVCALGVENAGVWQEFPHEIIEFPTVLVDLHTGQMVSEFRSFVCPSHRPKLSNFCTDLTGIRQAEVNSADDFVTVLHRYLGWLQEQTEGYKCAIATDGPWDLNRFLYLSCIMNNEPFPRRCKSWVNVRKAFASFYDQKRCGIGKMLEILGMSFSGRQHSGIADSRNLARVVLRMQEDGYEWSYNDYVDTRRVQDLRFRSLHWTQAESGKGDREEQGEEAESSDADSDEVPQKRVEACSDSELELEVQ